MILLEHVSHLAAQHPAPVATVEALFPHLQALCEQFPNTASETAISELQIYQLKFTRCLRDNGNSPASMNE